MHISVDKAKIRLDDLVDRAEAGDVAVLTLNGREFVQFVPIAKSGVEQSPNSSVSPL